MGYLVGTDEAGYGPNLGPLVISATVWEVPDGIGNEELFDRVAHVIAQRPGGVSDGGPLVAMADSKVLYAPEKGLSHLGRGVAAALGLLNHRVQAWRDVWLALAPAALEAMSRIPWYAEFDGTAATMGHGNGGDALAGIESLDSAGVESLRAGLAAAGVRLVALRSRVIFEGEFNDLLERHGTKGEALSQETLGLAAKLIATLPNGQIAVVCDKHGGRNCYGRLLAEHFPEWLVEVRGESRAQSVYRFGPPERRVDICFRAKGESCLSAALASMASKYLRELAMMALNHYWRARLPQLRPTAGYPEDAKRFRAAIGPEKIRLGISDDLLWRRK